MPAGDSPRKSVRHGGFYTQDEVREIVRYAAERFITVVPEIEMPGHAQAAIAAYPELGTEGPVPPVSPDWGVHDYLYNVDESTFAFLENVLTEVMQLFPGSTSMWAATRRPRHAGRRRLAYSSACVSWESRTKRRCRDISRIGSKPFFGRTGAS